MCICMCAPAVRLPGLPGAPPGCSAWRPVGPPAGSSSRLAARCRSLAAGCGLPGWWLSAEKGIRQTVRTFPWAFASNPAKCVVPPVLGTLNYLSNQKQQLECSLYCDVLGTHLPNASLTGGAPFTADTGLAAGCWLLAAGCWLLAAGCWLLAVGCWLLAAGCWLLAAGCWLLQP